MCNSVLNMSGNVHLSAKKSRQRIEHTQTCLLLFYLYMKCVICWLAHHAFVTYNTSVIDQILSYIGHWLWYCPWAIQIFNIKHEHNKVSSVLLCRVPVAGTKGICSSMIWQLFPKHPLSLHRTHIYVYLSSD